MCAGVALLTLGWIPAQAVRADATPTVTSLAPYTAVATGLKQPRGVAVAPNGNVYVSDEHDGRIYELAVSGARRVVASGLKKPRGLALEDAGHLLVVADKTPPVTPGPPGVVLRVDIVTGASSVLAGGIQEPRGVARASDGTLYVTAKGLHDEGDDDAASGEGDDDEAEDVVLRVAADGAVTVVAQGLEHADGIVALADGTLVVAAEKFEREQDAGELRGSLFTVAADGSVSVLLATRLEQVGGVVLDATGAYFVAGRREQTKGTLVKRRVDGGVNDLASGLREPAGLALAPNGDLLAADPKTGTLWRFQAPAAPVVNASDPAYTNQNPYLLSGTAQAAAEVRVSGGASLLTTTAGADGAWSLPVPLAANVESELAVLAVGSGGQGLASAATRTHLVHDDLAPVITAVGSPAANAAGWNNADVTVAFTCSDTGSGLASCTPPVSVATEGAGQTVSGTAVDRAGNTATATLVVSLDKTAPTISALSSPEPNAAGWINTDASVSFFCVDLLSNVANCTPAVVVTSEGAGQTATGSAVDFAGNSASTSVTFNIDKTPPIVTAVATPTANERGWNNSDVTVAFQAADALSGVESVSPAVTFVEEGAGLTAEGSASDRAGNQAAPARTSVNIDKTPPTFAITSPAAGTVRRVPNVIVTGDAQDANGIASVRVAGLDAGSQSPWSLEVPLQDEGPRTLVAEAQDVAGNLATASVDVVLGIPPVVTITSPADLAAVGATPITVTGTVDDPQATITVGIEAVPAVVNGNTFTATGVPLREGGNVVTAAAADPLGNASSASVTVVLDTTAPRVLVDSPRSGSVTTDETVTVTGRINDLVLGTVNSGQAQVSVNGIVAEVANRTFIARGVALAPGSNALTATATDAVGNTDSQTVTVLREAVAGPRLRAVSGDAQAAGIGEVLSQALTVALSDGQGAPMVGRDVVFRVAANNGELIGTDGTLGRGLVMATDVNGYASVRLRLGTRAGVGNNRVEATSPGIVGSAIFTASGTAQAADKVNVDSGNGQIGAVGQPLPHPFVAVVTDAGSNRLGGVPVTFRVLEGDGTLLGGSETTVVSDSDGRAVAVLTLGPRPGQANNVVSASVPGHEDEPAGFSASAFEPGDPLETSISGVVLDNSNNPIPGVTLRVRGTALAASADAQGQFRIQPVPVGNVHLQADATTAQRPGTWPSLEFEIVTVPGIDNTLGMPIYLTQLDTADSIFVDETHGGTLTLADYPGFSLTVAPNSATFPDGTRRGVISVTSVHVDKVPMVPNFGQQPRFIVTIQPPGARFDPPAVVTHPNVDGLKPGEVTEIYSFDHDMGSFVATGTATVSEDGTVLRSDPGMGIVKGGWHCGGNPSGSGTAHNCPTCKKCVTPNCVADDSQTPPQKAPDDCKKEVCRGGSVASDPNDGETPKQKAPDDCKKEVCRSGAPRSDNDDSETPKRVEGNCKKEVCRGGTTASDPDDSDTPSNASQGCCKGDIFTRPQEDCCGGQQKYTKATQCCDNNVVKPAHPIANVLDPNDCPNRVQRVPGSSNGCTGVPDNPTAVTQPIDCGLSGNAPSFTPACNNHDLGYDTCGRPKATTDAQFGAEMRALCNTVANADCRATCLGHADRYEAVVSAIDHFYVSAQTNVCRCCPAP